MANVTKVIFSEDKTVARLLFDSGKESDFFPSKAEILEALYDIESGKTKHAVTQSVFIEVREAVLATKEFPWRTSKTVLEINMGLLSALLNVPDELPTKTYFRVCENCGKHGQIITKGGIMTGDIQSVQHGIMLIARLLKEERIDEQEALDLSMEVQVLAKGSSAHA